MTRHLAFTAIITVLGILPLSAAEKDDNAKIQGTWKVTSRESDGEKVKGPNLGKIVFAKDSFTGQGKRTFKGKFNLDPNKKPKHLDLNLMGENGKVVPVKAIYKFDGDRLIICIGELGKDRPSEFNVAEGSKDSLATLEKVKDEEESDDEKPSN